MSAEYCYLLYQEEWKSFNSGDFSFLSCSLYIDYRQHRPQRLIQNVSELVKDWSNTILLPETKNCQAAASWTHFPYTRNVGSLQQREQQEAERQSLLEPKIRCSHLAENSCTISHFILVFIKNVQF